MGEDSVSTLAYAPRARHSRVWWRGGLMAIGIAFIAAVGWRWGPGWWQELRIWWAERASLEYEAPANRVVCAAGPEARELCASGSGYEWVDQSLSDPLDPPFARIAR